MIPRSLAFSLLALVIALPSCSSNRIDVKHPTVAQMDQLDVQWGLPPRQNKGGAKRLMPTPESLNLPPSLDAATAPMAPQTLPTTVAPAPVAPVSTTPVTR